MPTETIIVITGVILVMALFALTIAWADHRTRHSNDLGAAE